MKTLLMISILILGPSVFAQVSSPIRITVAHRVDASQSELRWTVKGDTAGITDFQIVRISDGGTGVTNTVLVGKIYSEHRALTRETTYTYRDVVPAGFYTYKVRSRAGDVAGQFSEPIRIQP